MNTISTTTVPIKKVGDGLNAEEVNSINGILNQEVAVGNSYLKNFCNLNQELEDYTKTFSLSEAIANVPESRKNPGIELKFLGLNKKYLYYTYMGSDLTGWSNLNNWNPSVTIIDGGEW